MSKKLLERIEELERKVRDLEARPIMVPIIVQPAQVPITPYPGWPPYPYNPVWCGSGGLPTPTT